MAQSVRADWAAAGVCVRLAAEECGLASLPVRREDLDLCFAEALTRDPRGQALIRLLTSRSYRQLVSDLPGYHAKDTGQLHTV